MKGIFHVLLRKNNQGGIIDEFPAFPQTLHALLLAEAHQELKKYGRHEFLAFQQEMLCP